MRRQLCLILSLAAWLLATGSQWDFVQTFAWGRMIADYSREMTVSQAIAKTFSPGTMCRLCHAVAEAKQKQSNETPAPEGKMPGKILLVCAPAVFISTRPTLAIAGHLTPQLSLESLDRAPPLTPPPREAA